MKPSRYFIAQQQQCIQYFGGIHTQIYGSDSDTAAKLRSGVGGRLKGNAAKGEGAALMPFAEARQCAEGGGEGQGEGVSECFNLYRAS